MSASTFGDAAAYDPIVDVYDLEHADFDDDVGLYRSLADVVGDPILELGCGSGRILLPLAEDGFRVTGVDGSPAMLARAESRAIKLGIGDRVSLVHADIRATESAPGGPFGLVIIGLNTLLHLPSQAAQIELLAAAHRALDPRGQLVIDVFNPTPHLLTELSRGITHEGAWAHPQGGTVDKWSSRELVASDQRLETTIWYDHTLPDHRLSRTRSAFSLRYVHFAELVLMLQAAEFVEWRAYGGYDLEPFDDGAERMVVTAEVTASASSE